MFGCNSIKEVYFGTATNRRLSGVSWSIIAPPFIDGRELFYLTLDGTLMAVAVNSGPAFEFGAPQPLFETGLLFMPHYKIWMDQYAVSRDGQRFLLNRRVAETAAGAITAVIPW
jgi:hypothetical protein